MGEWEEPNNIWEPPWGPTQEAVANPLSYEGMGWNRDEGEEPGWQQEEPMGVWAEYAPVEVFWSDVALPPGQELVPIPQNEDAEVDKGVQGQCLREQMERQGTTG